MKSQSQVEIVWLVTCFWLCLVSLCSDALLQVCATFPGSLHDAGGDICCRTAEQTQKQKGRPLTHKLFLIFWTQSNTCSCFNPLSIIWLLSSGSQLAGPGAFPPPVRALRPERPVCGRRWGDGQRCGGSSLSFRDHPGPNRTLYYPTPEPEPVPVQPESQWKEVIKHFMMWSEWLVCNKQEWLKMSITQDLNKFYINHHWNQCYSYKSIFNSVKLFNLKLCLLFLCII